MRRLILIVAAVTAGCLLPTAESFRPRTVDVSVDGGQSEYRDRDIRGRSDDWRVGVTVGFEITYEDETEEDE